MHRYDRDRGYRGREYGWGGRPSAGFWGRGVGLYRQWGTPWESGYRGGYDRGEYGRWYPGYDGYYGGRAPGHDDQEVLQAVRESLYQDNYLDANRIGVEVNGGVVTLTGEVDDFLEARYAWDDAWETPGVRGVINQVRVRND